ETTYFGISLTHQPNEGSSAIDGQKAAQIWYVIRPRRIASASKSCWRLKSCISGSVPRSAHWLRPLRCSSDPGASINPSMVRNSVTISRPMCRTLQALLDLPPAAGAIVGDDLAEDRAQGRSVDRL